MFEQQRACHRLIFKTKKQRNERKAKHRRLSQNTKVTSIKGAEKATWVNEILFSDTWKVSGH